MPFEPGDYRLDIPTASVFEDLDQYIPLMLSAVDGWLDIPTRWLDDDPDGTAHLYMEDLRAFIQDLPLMMVPIGGILIWPKNTLPDNYLWCDGTNYAVDEYPSLYAAIEDAFGSTDPGINFNVPDLRSRFPLGTGGLVTLGNTGGAQTVTLTIGQIPPHTHTILTRTNAPIGGNPRLAQAGGSAADNSNQATESTGGSGSPAATQPHQNMPPYIGLNYIIRAK